jgi:nucleoside-diphosphate-sugar epimerase
VRKAIEARDDGRDYIEAWGAGVVTREFVFVRDAACAIAAATERYNKPEPVSIGSGMEITIRDLAATICRLCDFRGEIRWNCSRPDGRPHRCSESSRAFEEFGFQATTDLMTGLRETIAWYESQGQSAARPTIPISSHVKSQAA